MYSDLLMDAQTRRQVIYIKC